MKTCAVVLIAFALQLFGSGVTSAQTNSSIVVDNDPWWGPGENTGEEDCSIRPFNITWDEKAIEDLRNRLASHRPLSPPLEGVNFTYGFNSANIDDWVSYWADDYDFTARLELINQFPSFKTNIQGLDIYFIHIKPQVSENVEIVPLLLIHGWPGSVLEFRDAIPLLTAVDSGRDFAFELIIPSIPGFGYSDAPVRPNCGVSEVAVIFNNLMQRLGHEKYYVQGGDLGAIIGQYMATLLPEHILGYHSNLLGVYTSKAAFIQILGSIYPPLVVNSSQSNRLYPLSTFLTSFLTGSGYFHEQATKPDTIGAALTDSPVGLLAYILEKFSSWVLYGNDKLADGGLNSLDKNFLIDDLMMYWMPSTATTAMRFYSETYNLREFSTLRINEVPVSEKVPVWGIQAQTEVWFQPPLILKTKYPTLLNVTALSYGGHFLAWQLPEVFSDDVLLAVKAFRNWHNGVGELLEVQQSVDISLLTAILQLVQGTHEESWFFGGLVNNTISALGTIFAGYIQP